MKVCPNWLQAMPYLSTATPDAGLPKIFHHIFGIRQRAISTLEHLPQNNLETVKNLIISERGGKVRYLSDTYEGGLAGDRQCCCSNDGE